jgi:hypothetical protein
MGAQVYGGTGKLAGGILGAGGNGDCGVFDCGGGNNGSGIEERLGTEGSISI